MNINQEFTPKYWVCHNIVNDDVMLSTASKSFNGCEAKVIEEFGEHLLVQDDIRISLVEIKLVVNYNSGIDEAIENLKKTKENT